MPPPAHTPEFPDTRWSLVLAAARRDGVDEPARRALDEDFPERLRRRTRWGCGRGWGCSLGILREVSKPGERDLLFTLRPLGLSLVKLGRRAEAAPLLTECPALVRQYAAGETKMIAELEAAPGDSGWHTRPACW